MINTSDGTFGALVASESIGIAETVVNGPGGCRDRAHILIGTMVDTDPENMGCCAVKNYSKRTGIPCTFLNGNDIIFGAEEKLESSLTDIEKVSKKDLAVIETLGASLICTDQEKIRQDHPGMIPIRDDLSSLDFAGGFDICSVRILEKTLTGER
ncbi:MAG: hypothetical protein MJZ21_05515, partial [archaeon]|nr:hypothetical protein [archaeon]